MLLLLLLLGRKSDGAGGGGRKDRGFGAERGVEFRKQDLVRGQRGGGGAVGVHRDSVDGGHDPGGCGILRLAWFRVAVGWGEGGDGGATKVRFVESNG